MKFTELGLVPEILRSIADQGYETPTPIQAQAIPVKPARKIPLTFEKIGIK
jgi:ATP-dependent RNA helicase RhlE